ncbi:hypothetical protein [Thalassoroseus pseudoceratinae]|uniref:hypothetical protein n=1 Tax=Thalassoroseus pseudoceratinae TaxID=2713176 RepID=UPI0014221367|nr:hypothetical protein [Thalassoroseus pseudoceratinae]
MLDHADSREANAPYHSVTDHEFWRTELSNRNQASGLEPVEPSAGDDSGSDDVETVIVRLPAQTVPGYRLVDRFKSEVKPLIAHERTSELATLLESWRQRLACIKNKDHFNHWDDDDSSHLQSTTTGIGWTSRMLEHCRSQGELRFIPTGESSLDFALLNMELNLGISSKRNYFRLGCQDYVKPDGLGVRQADRSFCVIEVKGPQDDGEMFEATLQALLGALAVHAKREMILRIARTARGLRPAVHDPQIPEGNASLGIYVIVSEQKAVVAPDLEKNLKVVLQAAPRIREIVHFIPTADEIETFASLSNPKVFRR